MWLRDSSSQVLPYLHLCKIDLDIKKLVKGLIKQQFKYILIDPYANAFNKEPNNKGHNNDITEKSPWVWERKYEIDSLIYPLWLVYKYYQNTEDNSFLTKYFMKCMM